MAQENLESKINGWADNLNVLGESLSALSTDELRQVINSLSEKQKRRMFVILYNEKSTADFVYDDEPKEEE